MNRSLPLSTLLSAALLAFSAGPALAQAAAADAPAAQQVAPQVRHGHQARTPEQRQQAWQQRTQAFKEKLQLTAQQEGAWTAWQQALQPAQHARLDRQAIASLTTPERIDRLRAERAQRSAEMDRRGEATKAFYAALTQSQQQTFDRLGAERRHGKHPLRRGHGAAGQPHGAPAA